MNLIHFLKQNTNTRKIFGQRELKIIEKQRWGIPLTQSEKNRLSRDIRPKFQFMQEITRHDFDFKLKKGGKVKELIENAKEIILNHRLRKKIKRITLYGSTIDNTRTFRSDIDIAVEFDEITKEDAFDFRVSIAAKASDTIDVQVYNVLPDKITKEIKEKGRILYER